MATRITTPFTLIAQTEPLVIDIDNDTDAIAVDSEMTAQADTSLVTHVALYYGTHKEKLEGLEAAAYYDMGHSEAVDEADLSLTADAASGEVRATVKKGRKYSRNIYVHIEARSVNGSRSIHFNLIPQASGEPGVTPIVYQLAASPNVLSFARTEDGEIEGKTQSVKVSVKRINGAESEITDTLEGYTVYAGWDGNVDYENPLAVGAIVTAGKVQAESYRNLTLELWKGTKAEGTLYDRESIPFVRDGHKGSDPLQIDLDNDNDRLPVDSAYTCLSDYSVTTHASLYNGKRKLTLTYLSAVAYTDAGCTQAYPHVSTSTNMANGQVTVSFGKGQTYSQTVYVQISAGSAEGSRTILFTIGIQASGKPGENPIIRQLAPSPNSLPFSRLEDGSLKPYTHHVKLYVKQTEGNQTQITDSLEGYTVYAGWDGSVDYDTPLSVGGEVLCSQAEAQTHTELTLELWEGAYEAGKTWDDRESLPIVKDGEKGADSLLIDLDNDSDLIPVDSEHIAPESVVRQTTASLFYGTKRQTISSLSATEYTDSGLTQEGSSLTLATDPSSGTVTATTTKGGTYDSPCYVKVTAECEAGKRSAVFTLGIQASGAPGLTPVIYQLNPTPNSVVFARGEDGTIEDKQVSILMAVKRTEGEAESLIEAAVAGLYVYCGFESVDYSKPLAVGSSFSVSKADALRYSQVAVELWRGRQGTAGSTRIDRESLPIVKDGEKGADSLSLQLDNAADTIPVDSSHTATESVSRQTTASLFYGLEKQPLTTLTATAYSDAACTVESGLLSLSTDQRTGIVSAESGKGTVYDSNLFVKITAGCEKGTLSGVFTLSPQVKGEDAVVYSLIPTPDALHWNVGSGGKPESVTQVTQLRVKLTRGAESEVLTSAYSGLNIYAGPGGRMNYNNAYPVGASYGVTSTMAALYGTVDFELWVGSYGSGKLADKSSVSLMKDGAPGEPGEPGQPGEPGEDGNGIVANENYYQLTETPEPPEANPTEVGSGWILEGASGCPNQPTRDKPYLWQCQHTAYSNGTVQDSVRILAVANLGSNPQLLEATAFDSETIMAGKYQSLAGTVVTQARGGYNAFRTAGLGTANSKDMLQQAVYKAGVVAKIEPLTYYTLSFYARINGGGSSGQVLSTFLYPSALLNVQKYFVDGEVRSSNVGSGANWDGHVAWDIGADMAAGKGDSSGWVFHSVSFKTRSSFAEAQHVLFRARANGIEVCQPKLEKGVMPTPWCEHEYDTSMECSHNPCGKWSAGTTYYYCNGQRDVVRAQANASGGETWWRMKLRTNASGYTSITQPYLDNEHWEKGNNLKFTVVDSMFAEEIFTDKLTVSKIRGKDNCFTVDENGDVNCNTGTFTNVKISGNGDITGFVRKRATIITPSTLSNYTLESSGRKRIDFMKTGSMIVFENDADGGNFADLGTIELELPNCLYKFSSTAAVYDPAMLYVGSTIVVSVSGSGMVLNIKGVTSRVETDGYIDSVDTKPMTAIETEGAVMFMRCIGAPYNTASAVTNSGYAVAWSYRTTKASNQRIGATIKEDPWTVSKLPPSLV